MTAVFDSRLAEELDAFLAFKRARGYKYARAEYMLRSFDRFVASIAKRQTLDQTMLAWLGRRPNRKAISVSMELSVIREFWRYLNRRDPRRFAREPRWPRLPNEPRFVPYVLSTADIRQLLRLCAELDRPRFRSSLYRALLLVLYCTGLRFGEALRLRIRDVDVRRHVLFVSESKGRSRWVPFRRSLGAELALYLRARCQFVGQPALPDDRMFVGANRRYLPKSTAWGTLAGLFRATGLKPDTGRSGPRPCDLRHRFAVHRLTGWYRQGVDLHGRLPWLSAYLGHVDLLGTETYLTATPELLGLASERFRRRYCGRAGTR